MIKFEATTKVHD